MGHTGRMEVQHVSHIAVSIIRSRIAMHVKFNIYAGVIPGFWCSGVTPVRKTYGSDTRIIMPTLNDIPGTTVPVRTVQ
jgi:hypothetical protein